MAKTTQKKPEAKTAFKPASTTSEIDSVVAASRKAAATRKATSQTQAVSDIASNPFHKIMFDPAMSLQEKQATMAQTLTFDKSLTDEQNAERLSSFVEFSSWVQEKRKELAVEMLELNDTEAFAELKVVIDELGQGVLDIKNQAQPFLDILDALYQMQLQGVKTSDLLDEIIKDREAHEKLKGSLKQYERDVLYAERSISSYQDQIADLKTDTRFFGWSSTVKPESQARINRIELKIEAEKEKLSGLADKILETSETLKAPRISQYEGLEGAKENLAALLDISSEEHRSRQGSLNSSAAEFVRTSDERVAQVLSNIKGMNDRIEVAGKNSGKVLGLYAVMNDAIETAVVSNHDVLSTLDAPEGEEGLIAKMQREETRESSLRHIKTLNGVKEETVKMYDGLSREKAELNGMLDNNNQQISATRYLHGSGIANMGMQLNAMITALASAANGQSTKVAQELVDEMGSNAIMIRGKDSLRAALDFQATNDTLERTIQLANQSAELMRNASAVTGDALEQQQELLKRVKAGADDMQRAITEGLELYAEKTAPSAGNDNVAGGSVSHAKSDLAGFNLK